MQWNDDTIHFTLAWKNSVGKTKPWSRTKSQQKVWNRRPTAQRYNYLEEGNEQSNRIQTPNDGTYK